MTRGSMILATRGIFITTIICSTIVGIVNPGTVSGQELSAALKLLATSSEARLIAADAATNEYFGRAVAIYGDTAVVGADGNDPSGIDSAGSAYIFERNQGGADNWGQVAKLTASDAAEHDYFGTSVAIYGDTVIIGADAANHSGLGEAGSAYIFERNHGGADAWGQVAKLTASDAESNEYFGRSVAISGDTAIVGVLDDHSGFNNAGSAYVFVRDQGGAGSWGEVAKLTASDAAAMDTFGNAVAISGDTAVIGAFVDDHSGLSNAGSAYVFERNQGGTDSWGQVAKLMASDGATQDFFGQSVAISGATVIVGADSNDHSGVVDAGSAYVFERNQGGADAWGQVAKLTASDAGYNDTFGFSAGISGDTAVIGALAADPSGIPDAGSAYVFERNRGGADAWGQVTKLTTSDAAAGDRLGFAAAISGETVIAGLSHDDHSSFVDAGSAQVYQRHGDTWTEVAKPVAPDASSFDHFGVVAMDADVLVVGSPGDDHSAVGNAGSAYVYERNQGGADNWGLVTKIFAADPTDGAACGTALAIAGDTVAVGCPTDNPGSVSEAGSAYVFERNQGGTDTWGQVAKLTAADGAAGDLFGSAVGISGDTVVVGAPEDNHAEPEAGSAYIFSRNQGGADAWGQVAKLTAADAAFDDNFGCSVAISGDAVVVGADHDDHSGHDQAGSAYIFARNQGGAENWGQLKKIASGDPGPYEWFGSAVAISNDTAVVSAVLKTSVYVFQRNHWGADAWGEVEKIAAADVGAYHFGSSVGLFGDRMIVGCHVEADLSGSAYLFERNEGGADAWGFVEKLTASDGVTQDYFGRSVAITHTAVAIGSPQDDDGGPDSGSAYIYRLSDQASEEIFSHGFELGNTTGWSSTVGG